MKENATRDTKHPKNLQVIRPDQIIFEQANDDTQFEEASPQINNKN